MVPKETGAVIGSGEAGLGRGERGRSETVRSGLGIVVGHGVRRGRVRRPREFWVREPREG
jgi:hypothetical protein